MNSSNETKFLVIFTILSVLLRIIIFVCAAILMWYQKEGWGWLVFAGIIISPSFKYLEKINNK